MIPATTPEELVRLGRHYWEKGARGMLVSGGLTKSGKLPIKPFLGALKELKEVGYIISVHTGIVGKEEALMLSEARVDIADYELILDEGAISRSKGLNVSPELFVKGMELLLNESVRVVPHMVVGLPGSSSDWIKRASCIIRELDIDRTVVLAFIPTAGTPLSNERPPTPEEVKDAIDILSKVSKVSLGCMRPPWLKKKIDLLALGSVDRIANPHYSLKLNKVFACCSIPDELIDTFLPED